MPARAKDGTCLPKLVAMAIPLCQAAQRYCPRRGPGRLPKFEEWAIAVLILVAVLNRRKSKSAQYRFLHERRTMLQRWLHWDRFPARSSYFDRYRRAHRTFQVAVTLQGRRILQEGLADPTTVAVDKSLLPARGPVWHRRRGQPCKPRPGVDEEGAWGYSEHHGWVYGYSFETVVTASQASIVVPLMASVASASHSECRSFPEKIPLLPDSTRHVLGDSAYDTNEIGEAIEYGPQGRATGRWLVCPLQGRAGKPKVGRYVHRGRRERLRRHRKRRLVFFNSPQGRGLYKLRGRTVEPFHEWFKNCFELGHRVWHRGLDNNQTQLLASMFAYQLLIRYNHKCGRKNGQIQWIFDRL